MCERAGGSPLRAALGDPQVRAGHNGPRATGRGDPGDTYAIAHRVAALDLSTLGGASSTLSALTTPSSTIIE